MNTLLLSIFSTENPGFVMKTCQHTKRLNCSVFWGIERCYSHVVHILLLVKMKNSVINHNQLPVVHFEHTIISLSSRDRVSDLVLLEYDEVVSFSLARNLMALYTSPLTSLENLQNLHDCTSKQCYIIKKLSTCIRYIKGLTGDITMARINN